MLTCAFLISAIPGCGGGYTMPASTQTQIVAPEIAQQPANQSVPMGLTATYTVAATGESLHYQWSKNGAEITGATSNVYVTHFDNFQADMQNNMWPAFANGASPVSAASVLTSLDLEPANLLFAVSWIQSAQQTAFELRLAGGHRDRLRGASRYNLSW
jgi:hypothetical protein